MEGREIELAIDSLAYQGAGVGRHEGVVVFVPFTAPGDRVRAMVVSDRGRYLNAELLQVLVPSASRVEPPCPHFGACGGCQWQHVSYDQQLLAKRAIVAESLRRIGGSTVAVEPVVPSPLAYRYRNRARFHVGAGGVVGFFRRGTHTPIALSACPVLEEPLERALAGLAAGTARPRAAEIELRVEPGGDVREAGGLPFGQVNAAVNILLQQRLAEAVARVFATGASGAPAASAGPGAPNATGAPAAPLAILDLYCGDGNLSLPLAAPGRSILGYDQGRSAVRAAAARARALHADAEYRQAAISADLLAALGRRRFDVTVIDPPRDGLGSLARAAAALGAPLTALVSCAPPTLARDLRVFLAEGYAVELVQPFDMFPQTFHVETLVLLRRPRP